jgi:hypothetical protein
MDLISPEKFLYINKCDLSIKIQSNLKLEKYKVHFIITFTNIYFFQDVSQRTNLINQIELMEQNLICRLPHESIYISNYDDNQTLTFSHREDVKLI